MSTSPTIQGNKGVIDRAFAILACFSDQKTHLTLKELVELSGLPKATVHRLAAQLVHVGAMHRIGDSYQLGVRLFELACTIWTQRVLREVAVPHMHDLFEACHETIQLGWLDETEVLYVDRIQGVRTAPVPTLTGGRMPTHCTALGKAMLAFSYPESLHDVLRQELKPLTPHTITVPRVLLSELAKVRETGWAYDREESIIGVGCVASPILHSDGHAIGALSVSGPSARVRALRMEAKVKDAADNIARAVSRRLS